MNDLRLILLGIGLLIIAVIYLWGTLKQKSQNLAQTRKFISLKKSSVKNFISTYDEEKEVNVETLAELDTFLNYHEPSDINASDFSFNTKIDDINAQDTELSKSTSDKFVYSNTEKTSRRQIIIFLIKSSPGKIFSGMDILKAADVSGLKFGNMNTFHYHGVKGMESKKSIFSLANIYEPGYFELDKMEPFQTKGLALFMQLPTPIDDLLAFSLMHETAIKFKNMLEGEIYNFKHKLIDEKKLQEMRDVVFEFS